MGPDGPVIVNSDKDDLSLQPNGQELDIDGLMVRAAKGKNPTHLEGIEDPTQYDPYMGITAAEFNRLKEEGIFKDI